MKVALLVTMLTCLLALGGCLTVPETIADSDGSVEDPGSYTQIWEGVGGAAGEAFGTGGAAGGVAGAAGEAFATGGVGGEAGGEGGTAGGVAGSAGEAFATGGVGGEAGGEGGAGSEAFTGGVGGGAFVDASMATEELQLGTRSAGCERLENSDLCLGEGWMLAEAESIPACGESGAYRICTFETDACVSHTVMMVQRCD